MIAIVCSVLLASSAPEAALRLALDSSADWTMHRQPGGSDRLLVSSGTVDCRAGRGILWKTLEPFEASVEMTTNSMIFVDEDGTRTKKLSELPHYETIRAKTDAFAAGDSKAFDGLFRLESEELPDGGWRLKLTPEVSAMKRLIVELELTGTKLPTNAVMRTGDGGTTRIGFRERKNGR